MTDQQYFRVIGKQGKPLEDEEPELATELEIRLKEGMIARHRFNPKPYDPTPPDVFLGVYAKESLNKIKNDNRR